MNVIFFYCPECREELEGEDSIRGARMKCPACFKEIEVPQASVKVASKTTRREGRDSREAAAPASEGIPGSKFILVVLLAGLVGLLLISGIGYTLHLKAQERTRKALPMCGACDGKGQVPCAACASSKKTPCKVCSGTGKYKNFKDDEEVCYSCSGRGALDCRICDGRGQYGCMGCEGTGRLAPATAPPKR